MPRYRFQWSNISPELLQSLAVGLDLTGEPVFILKERYGSRPKPEFVRDTWPILLEQWLSEEPASAKAIATELRAKGLGVTSIEDNLTYLKSCNNSSGLRATVVDAFISLGETSESEEDQVKVDNSEVGAEGSAESILLAKVKELREIWHTFNQDEAIIVKWADALSAPLQTTNDVQNMMRRLVDNDRESMLLSLPRVLLFSYLVSTNMFDSTLELARVFKELDKDDQANALLEARKCCPTEITEGLEAIYGMPLSRGPNNTREWIDHRRSDLAYYFDATALLSFLGLRDAEKERQVFDKYRIVASEDIGSEIDSETFWNCMNSYVKERETILRTGERAELKDILAKCNFFSFESSLAQRHIPVPEYLEAVRSHAAEDQAISAYALEFATTYQLSLGFNMFVDDICSINGAWASSLTGPEVFSYKLGRATILDEMEPWLAYFEDLDFYPVHIQKELDLAVESGDENAWKCTTAYHLSESWLFDRANGIDWEFYNGDELLSYLELVNNEGDTSDDIPDEIIRSDISPHRFRVAEEYKAAWIEKFGDESI